MGVRPCAPLATHGHAPAREHVGGHRYRHPRGCCDPRAQRGSGRRTLGAVDILGADRDNGRAFRLVQPEHGERRLLQQLRHERGLGNWLVDANSNATLTANHYVVTGWTEIHHALLTPYAVAHRAISVATTVDDYPADDVSMGAGCQSAYGISPALVYQMVVYPDGQWYIEEARAPGGVQTLLSGGTSALGAAASVQLTCVMIATTSTTETTQLVGYVNGIRVGAIGDQTDQNRIGGYVPVLMLGTFGPTESATFTGITVRSITQSG